MRGDDWFLRLADVAADQGGLLTTAQAKTVGVTPQQIARLAKSGVLERVVHGVHRLAGTTYDPLSDLRAAWLALEPQTLAGDRLARADPGGVISHRSAAVLHGLGDLDADLHEFTVSSRRRSRNPDVRFHTASHVLEDWTVVSGLPATTVAQTIADLAHTRTDGGHLAQVVSDALTGLDVELDEAAAALRPFAHYYGAPLGDGAALVERFLDDAGIPEATLELARAVTRSTNNPLGPRWMIDLSASVVSESSARSMQEAGASLLSTRVVSEALARSMQEAGASLLSTRVVSEALARSMQEVAASLSTRVVSEALARSMQEVAASLSTRVVSEALAAIAPQLPALTGPIGRGVTGESFHATVESLLPGPSLERGQGKILPDTVTHTPQTS
jgi:hypothetical protein